MLRNIRGEKFELLGRFPSGPLVSPGSCAVADIDSDNTPEILISDPRLPLRSCRSIELL